MDDDVVIGVSKGESENPKTKLMAEAVGADDWTATIKLMPDDKSVEILEPTELSKSSNLTNIRITKGYEFEKKETKELELSFKIKGKELKVVKNLDLLPLEVVELAPLLTSEDDMAIAGSARPEPHPRASAMVERNPLAATPITNANEVRIAWRDVKVKIGKVLAGETVTWSMTPLHIPGIALGAPNPGNIQPSFVGNWGTAVNADHRSRFSVSEAFHENDFTSGDPQLENATGANVPQTATTTVDEDGFTSIRVNLPPYGFNKARISIEIKEVSIDLIDLEVPGVIVLDAGHGTGAGTINGSNAIGTTARMSRAEEHAVARDITNSLVNYIRNEFETDRHFKVFATRSGAANVGFSDRTSVARDQGADVFISLHFNDPGVANITNRRHPFYLVDNTNNVNRNEDIQLGTDVRVAVQAAITAAESQQGIATSTDGLTSQQHETNLNRLNIDGKDVLTDADEVNRRGTPSEYTVTGLGNEVGYHPCRAVIIELEWFSNPAADALFNKNNIQNINGIPGRSAEIRTQLQQFMPNSLFNNILNHQ